MIFREATVNDISALSLIRLSVTENVLSDHRKVTPEMYAAYLTDIGKGWLCEINGDAVGFCIASMSDASIWALFVQPACEGQGIGTRLLELATDWMFAKGAPVVTLATSPNTRADRFYESLGWERGEIKPDGEVVYRLHRTPRA